jgi:flagella basal body P-ring formation protein FlgA
MSILTFRSLALTPALALALALGSAAAPGADAMAAGEDLAAPPLVLKTEVVLEDNVLRLGDLFEGLPAEADRPVARAPQPGRWVQLDARWLAALAEGHGLDWQPASALDRVTVSRASQTLGPEAIEAALRDSFARKGFPGGLEGELEVLLDDPAASLQLPTRAEPSLAVAGLSLDPASGRFSAQIVAPAGPTPQVRMTVTGRALVLAEVPVLSRRVAPGEVIGPGDLEWRSVPAERLAKNAVLDPANLLGKAPRRAIRPGEPVRATDLREPVLVPKNSLVTLRLETDRMVLTVQGRALEDGAAGQVVRVMNTKSNTVVNGVVVKAATVRVVQAALHELANN